MIGHNPVPGPMLIHSLSAIRAARPHLTLLSRVVLEAIHLSEGSIGPARAVARHLGLENRFQLARLLRREGLPSLHRLAAWATVLSWVRAADHTGVSLCRMAFRSNRYPAACYRLVREVTGLRWGQVRARGSAWVQLQFLREIEELDPQPRVSLEHFEQPIAEPRIGLQNRGASLRPSYRACQASVGRAGRPPHVDAVHPRHC